MPAPRLFRCPVEEPYPHECSSAWTLPPTPPSFPWDLSSIPDPLERATATQTETWQSTPGLREAMIRPHAQLHENTDLPTLMAIQLRHNSGAQGASWSKSTNTTQGRN